MAFGKKAKQPKTQYQTEQQALGRDAYGRITPALDRIESLTMNPDQYRQENINNYFNSGAQWNDAMRNYRRQMSQATANNYNATNGGYSSAGQRYYDDVQRAQNDYNARLYDAGVNTVNNMLSQDLGSANSYYNLLNNQHAYAAQPDAIDTANQLIDKANKNAWTSALNSAGDVASLFGPWGKAIGGAMKLGSWAGSTNYDQAIANTLNSAGINTNASAYTNPAGNTTAQFAGLTGLAKDALANDKDYWRRLFAKQAQDEATGDNTVRSIVQPSIDKTTGFLRRPY